MMTNYTVLPPALFDRLYAFLSDEPIMQTFKDASLLATLRNEAAIDIAFDALFFSPGFSPPFSDFRYGFTLAKDEDQRRPGIKPPIDVLVQLLGVFVGLIRQGLTGHEVLAVQEAFETSPADFTTTATVLAPAAKLRPPHRLPSGSSDLIVTGSLFARQLAAEIEELDRDLNAYSAAMFGSGLEGTIATLGVQTEIAQALATGVSRAEDGTALQILSSATTWGRMDRCEAALNAPDALLTGASDLALENRSSSYSLNALAILRAHQGIFAGRFNVNKLSGPGRIKTRNLSPDRPFVQLADDEAFNEIQKWSKLFEFQSWSRVAGVIWLGLSHIAFQGLRAFEDGNGRIGRLLLVFQMLEASLPALPLETAILRRHDEYLRAMDDAIVADDPEPFLRFLIAAFREAIAIGHRLLPGLRPLHQNLEQEIRRTGQVSRVPTSRWLGRLLLDEGDIECLVEGPVDTVIRHLEAVGLLTPLIISDRRFWTIAGVRELLQEASR